MSIRHVSIFVYLYMFTYVYVHIYVHIYAREQNAYINLWFWLWVTSYQKKDLCKETLSLIPVGIFFFWILGAEL